MHKTIHKKVFRGYKVGKGYYIFQRIKGVNIKYIQ